MYELYLLRTLMALPSGHNLGRTRHWKQAVLTHHQACSLFVIKAGTGPHAPEGKRENHAGKLSECSGTLGWSQ
ncbi:hypothetical protein F4W70_16045 [Pseudomonas cannabina]|nr:hypothetical protein F4W70_16045 [Pseudomonas cannabina]